jgi:hypothetical protein
MRQQPFGIDAVNRRGVSQQGFNRFGRIRHGHSVSPWTFPPQLIQINSD